MDSEYIKKGLRPNEVLLDGVITLDGSSDVSSHTIKGVLATIAHGATGQYTLTFRDRWYGGVKAFGAALCSAAASPAFAQCWSDAPDTDAKAATPIFKLGFSNGSAFTDPTASKKIVVWIVVQRGSVGTGA